MMWQLTANECCVQILSGRESAAELQLRGDASPGKPNVVHQPETGGDNTFYNQNIFLHSVDVQCGYLQVSAEQLVKYPILNMSTGQDETLHTAVLGLNHRVSRY